MAKIEKSLTLIRKEHPKMEILCKVLLKIVEVVGCSVAS